MEDHGNEGGELKRLNGLFVCRWRARWEYRAAAVLALLLLLTAAFGGGSDLAASRGVAAAPAANGDGAWLRVRTNLSGYSDRTSGYPDIATDSNGDYVAVVWSEGYDSSAGAKFHGRIYLRWISENTGLWSSRITVDDGANTQNDWSRRAAVALQRSGSTVTAHIVWVRFEKTFGWSVRYRACVLGGSCGSVSRVHGLTPEDSPLDVPDIAVASNGTPLVVWMAKDGSTGQQAIYYAERSGSTWSKTEASASGTYNDWPTVTAQDNTAYLAWVFVSGGQYSLLYSKKTVGGTWVAERQTVYSLASKPSHYPFLATGGGTVYLAWETEAADATHYRVNYKNDAGSGWQPSLTNERKTITDTCQVSTSGDEYARYLRPALAFWDDRLHAVWHHAYEFGEGEKIHRVLYSYSDNPNASNPTWEPPVIFAELGGDADLTAEERQFPVDNVTPRIAVGPPTTGETKYHVHVVIMLETSSGWDVWYLSNALYKTVTLPSTMRAY